MTKLNDQDILRAIRTGADDVVLHTLYKEILPRVRRYILSNSGSEEDAKDIFQDAVVILFRYVKLNRFDESKDVGGFIYAVSKNLWITKVKRSQRFVKLNNLDIQSDKSMDVLNDMISEEKSKAIEEVLDKIGEECKQLLKYSIYDKMSLKEIAVKMGYSNEGVAKTYNYRCKQKLVKLVKDNAYIISLFRK